MNHELPDVQLGIDSTHSLNGNPEEEGGDIGTPVADSY